MFHSLKFIDPKIKFFTFDDAWDGIGIDSYETSFDLGAKG